MVVVDDVGRREKDVVAAPAVDRPAGRIAHQSARHGLGLDPRMQLAGRVEGRAAGPVGDQLQADEQAAAADIADVMMVAEALLQARAQYRALLAHVVQQPLALDGLLHGEGGGTGHGMADVGKAVLE